VVWGPLHGIFSFTWDLMASDANHLFPNYFTAERGLLEHLEEAAGESCFSNPAWGRGFTPGLNAVIRAFRVLASDHGSMVVALIPSRTDVRWWHDDVLGWASVLDIRGRITYDAPDGSGPVKSWNKKKQRWEVSPAKFPTCVAIWEPWCVRNKSEIRSWDPYGRATNEDEAAQAGEAEGDET
jgi:DNA N-6-adenine-methyltransferase Dam